MKMEHVGRTNLFNEPLIKQLTCGINDNKIRQINMRMTKKGRAWINRVSTNLPIRKKSGQSTLSSSEGLSTPERVATIDEYSHKLTRKDFSNWWTRLVHNKMTLFKLGDYHIQTWTHKQKQKSLYNFCLNRTHFQINHKEGTKIQRHPF